MAKETVTSRFEAAISRYAMTSGQSGILVGYSGGADSSALLHLLSRHCQHHGIYLHAVHVNHGIRGDEALRDAEFCRRECEKMSVDFTLIEADIPKLAKASGRGIEEEAREYRYAAFAEIIKENPRLTCIATAHNADDNAETLLFNLARGCGVTGLRGIPPVREYYGIKIVRPLIYSLKKDVLGYCAENGIEYIFDSTNDDTVYTRNFIRHELMPRFSKINPSFVKSAQRCSEMARRDCDYLEAETDLFLDAHLTDGKIPTEVLASVHPAIGSRAIMKMFSDVSHASMDAHHVDEILEAAKRADNGWECSLPGKITARIHGVKLYFLKAREGEATPFSYLLKEGLNEFPERGFAVFSAKIGDDDTDLQKTHELLKNIYKLSICTRVNSGKINRELAVRSRMDGDAYIFGSMTRRLKKLYNDRGYDKEYREKTPIFCDKEGIIWVPGFPPADRVATDADTYLIYFYN